MCPTSRIQKKCWKAKVRPPSMESGFENRHPIVSWRYHDWSFFVFQLFLEWLFFGLPNPCFEPNISERNSDVWTTVAGTECQHAYLIEQGLGSLPWFPCFGWVMNSKYFRVRNAGNEGMGSFPHSLLSTSKTSSSSSTSITCFWCYQISSQFFNCLNITSRLPGSLPWTEPGSSMCYTCGPLQDLTVSEAWAVSIHFPRWMFGLLDIARRWFHHDPLLGSLGHDDWLIVKTTALQSARNSMQPICL